MLFQIKTYWKINSDKWLINCTRPKAMPALQFACKIQSLGGLIIIAHLTNTSPPHTRQLQTHKKLKKTNITQCIARSAGYKIRISNNNNATEMTWSQPVINTTASAALTWTRKPAQRPTMLSALILSWSIFFILYDGTSDPVHVASECTSHIPPVI